jgi:hypothetical protein
MKVIHPGIQYRLDDGNQTTITFRHFDTRLGVEVDGTSIDELMAVIRHKMGADNDYITSHSASSIPSFPSVKIP